MLQEGHRLKADGVDVVVGLVETHGREETARRVDGLEVIPRRRQEYRGHVLEEMDVDEVLARKPEVALIDELAHTNVPGSRNPKRYQDVQEILLAGIHVISTLNVQHLESLYDTVEKEVRVKVRERIPDSVVADADEVVNVDLAPEDLRKRLLEGKIYPPDRIQTALANFFTDSNLEALRELTLRELAAQIDLKRREHVAQEDTVTPDQVMVCLSSRGPNSEMLLRYGSRLAGRLNRNWYAVYVQTPHEEPTVIDSRTQTILSSTLTLAKELGAIVFTYRGEDIVNTILHFAREYRVGHVVMGKPSPLPFWKRIIGKRSVAERLLAEANGITIVVLDTWKEPTPDTAFVSEAVAPTLPRVAPVADRPHVELGNLLSQDLIVIWERPVTIEEAIRALSEVAARCNPTLASGDVFEAVMQRENEGSTFLGEGLAIPHARFAGLAFPIVALGLARQGVSETSVPGREKLIFLILSPERDPNSQLGILAQASRIAKNLPLMRTIWEAHDAVEILETIRKSEIRHDNGTTAD
jgi:two-component system sensor histidine kinase KdpD